MTTQTRKRYVNAKENQRLVRNRAGARAEPGERIELTDAEHKALTDAGYTLTPVADATAPGRASGIEARTESTTGTGTNEGTDDAKAKGGDGKKGGSK